MKAEPGFEARVRTSFARQAAMATLGARLEHIEPGGVDVVIERRADLTRQHGFIHAGFVASALDSAGGYAAFTLMVAGAAVPTIEFKVNLLAPARGPHFRFEGRVVKAGRTISVATGRAPQFGGEGAEEQLVATMTATLMVVVGRDGVRE